MDRETLYQAKPPWICVAEASPSVITNFGWSLLNQELCRVGLRFLRGKKMITLEGLDNEFGAALQFPWYYGENWAAFGECIRDLDWIPADTYVLIITDSVSVLSEEGPEQFSIFIRILESAGNEWSQPIEGRSPVPFHVIFQCGESDKSDIIARLTSAGASFGEMRIQD
jgi:hypothetical protein